MENKNRKGFTIIELLVVVAIITVLAAIVMTNVTSYINRGKNAAVRANMSTLLTNSAVWFDLPSLGSGTYDGFCASSTATNAMTEANDASGGVSICVEHTDNSKFCACSPMKTTSAEPANSFFCVDNTGNKKTYTGQAAGYCTTACPNAGGGEATCL